MTWSPSARVLAVLRAPSCRHYVCQQCSSRLRSRQLIRTLTTTSSAPSTTTAPLIPLRKQLKDEAKSRVKVSSATSGRTAAPVPSKYELTVGIEIHAELNTSRKLFSPAQTSLSSTPNTHVAPFDAALPGAQPTFQKDTLLPALRAALALGCEVQKESSWDRKHYFWWDQPQGYQVTQYYRPFALNGSLALTASDDIDPVDYPSISIGIKQVQMEQDTAKTVLQPPDTHLLDFNRVSHPLIEIISLPQIHYPKTAAAFVRKVQGILKAVDANSTGMEMGGLRADVNVSIRRRDATTEEVGLEYAGVKGLGQRTEIKNLSSFKAVEDAIVAERDRQIRVVEEGGKVEGETRGWTLGSNETRRLRGKEGEVDYRYMPDPDLGRVVIGEDLLQHLQDTMPMLPDEITSLLTSDARFNLTTKDAKTLATLDDGDRLDYYFDVVEHLQSTSQDSSSGKMASNWILHELGSLLSSSDSSFNALQATCATASSAAALSEILAHLQKSEVTLPTAKALFVRLFTEAASLSSNATAPHDVTARDIRDVIESEGLRLLQMSDEEYHDLARRAVEANGKMAEQVRKEDLKAREKAAEGEAKERQKKSGKVMWFVGWMVRQGEEGRVQPERAEKAVRQLLLGES